MQPFLIAKKAWVFALISKFFELLEYCLIANGKPALAHKLRSLIAPSDWQKITLPNEKEEQGVRVATQNDVPAILVYLKRHVQDCLYMYIDIGKYGLDNPNMQVWLDSDNHGINFVVMKYHDSISVYSDNDTWDTEAVMRLIQDQKSDLLPQQNE